METVRITGVQTFLTQPNTQRLIVVKVLTNQPGLYGLGCATFTQRHRAVAAAIEHHAGPLVIGRNADDIEDIWQGGMANGYWRDGPVLNNALSGIDMALWDIKGKRAGMPCYQLWGGACRAGAAAYVHANGNEPEDVAEAARKLMAQGYRHVRCQLRGYQGFEPAVEDRPEGALPGAYFDPRGYLRRIPALFEYLRRELGDEVELLHDTHERLAPVDAIALAKALEPYRLFFLEDLFAPEDVEWLRLLRSQCATPIAISELFVQSHIAAKLAAERLFDFIRVHVSFIGGITPAMKLARVCEAFGVRTAWHGPGDLSPVGVAANVHLDLTCPNFGVQEWAMRNQAEQDMFPHMPQVRQGYAYVSELPGLGVEFNETLAAKFPCDDKPVLWTVSRTTDGTLRRP